MSTEPRVFRIRAKQLGGHVHTRWYAARRVDASYAGIGTLVVDEHDWAALAPILDASPLVNIISDPAPESSAEPEWRCPRCRSDRWVGASLTGPVEYGGKSLRQCVPCGHFSNHPVPEDDSLPAPAGAADGMEGVYIVRRPEVPPYVGDGEGTFTVGGPDAAVKAIGWYGDPEAGDG